MQRIRSLFSNIDLGFSPPNFQIARLSSAHLAYKTLGSSSNPTLVLISDIEGQGITWPQELCLKLVESGFYVLRYDQRDCAQSTSFQFELTPYTFLDMAKDLSELLDYLNIDKAHLLGKGMGASIAQLTAIHFPQKVTTLTLIGSTCDWRPFNLAVSKGIPEIGALSSPSEAFLQAIEALDTSIKCSQKEFLQKRIHLWQVLNGDQIPLNPFWNACLQEEFIDRMNSRDSYKNYIHAARRSEMIVRSLGKQIQQPTLLFHGTEDPVFPPDHGQSLSDTLSKSHFYLIEGMGHVIHPIFYDLLTRELASLALDTP